MRIPINLASHPLESLRPLRTAVVLAAVLALLLGVVILNRELRSRNEFRALIQQQEELETSLADLQERQRELETALSTDEAQSIRERSGFMNSLILRKSLSWTQLFMDLEETLPDRARITAIHPQLNDTEDVDLDLTVVAASLEPLVEFLKNLESSTEFGPPAVGLQHYISERTMESGIELELTSRYFQDRLKNVAASQEREAQEEPQDSTEPELTEDGMMESGKQEGVSEDWLMEEILEEELPEETEMLQEDDLEQEPF